MEQLRLIRPRLREKAFPLTSRSGIRCMQEPSMKWGRWKCVPPRWELRPRWARSAAWLRKHKSRKPPLSAFSTATPSSTPLPLSSWERWSGGGVVIFCAPLRPDCLLPVCDGTGNANGTRRLHWQCRPSWQSGQERGHRRSDGKSDRRGFRQDRDGHLWSAQADHHPATCRHDMTEIELLRLAAIAEKLSEHPLGRAVVQAALTRELTVTDRSCRAWVYERVLRMVRWSLVALGCSPNRALLWMRRFWLAQRSWQKFRAP